MILAASILAFLFLSVFVTIERRHAGLLAATALMLAATVAPRVLFVVAPSEQVFRGMTHSDLVVTTYAAAIATIVVGLGQRGEKLTFPKSWVLLLVLLPWMALFVWGVEPYVWSGILHLLIAFLAWPLGHFVARCLAGDEKVRARFLLLVMTILGGQLLIGVLQLNNTIPSILSSNIDALDAGNSRITGTLGAAPNLSKIAYLFLLLGLQATGAQKQSNRVAGYIIISGSIALTALTVSRANLLACAATLALWLVLAPRNLTLGRRIFAGMTAGAVLFYMAGPTIQRFIQDPEGATRPELFNAALESLGQYWFLGTGVNSYVATLSETVPVVAATGQPVHNAALYLLMELGIILTVIFCWPFLGLVRRSAQSFRTSLEARIVLSALPGLGVIGWTGWGLLSTFVLPTLIFVLALLRQPLDNPLTNPKESR